MSKTFELISIQTVIALYYNRIIPFVFDISNNNNVFLNNKLVLQRKSDVLTDRKYVLPEGVIVGFKVRRNDVMYDMIS